MGNSVDNRGRTLDDVAPSKDARKACLQRDLVHLDGAPWGLFYSLKPCEVSPLTNRDYHRICLYRRARLTRELRSKPAVGFIDRGADLGLQGSDPSILG